MGRWIHCAMALMACTALLVATPASAGCAVSTNTWCGGFWWGGGSCCPSGQCCSIYGGCGTSSVHCGWGCQPAYGKCGIAAPSPPPPSPPPPPPPTKTAKSPPPTKTAKSPPPPPPSSNPSGGCPSGWLQAVGTVFDSWPKPGTKECVQYSGCQYAGQFNNIDGGDRSPCNNGAKYMDGGSGNYDCRFPPETVKSWSIAATYVLDSALLNRQLEVMVQGAPQRTVVVNVKDVCADADCGNCCKTNTGNAKWKLIDMEKGPASQLLGFSVSSPTFDINDVQLPAASGLRPGAPEGSVMPLCYRDVGPARNLP